MRDAGKTGLGWKALAGAVVALFVGGMLLRFRAPDDSYRAAFFDDFYYYLVVAQHLVRDGVPTFDGVTWTNGYHPLWLALITALLRLTGAPDRLFFVLLALAIAGFMAAAVLFLVRTARRLSGDDPLAVAVVLHAAIFLFLLGRWGMEVSGAAWAMSMLIWRLIRRPFVEQSLREAAVTGLLASVMVLMRLDAALFVLCLAGVLAVGEWPRGRVLVARAACFAAGGVLVPVYLVANRLIFGLWLPVSGAAKELRPGLAPSWHALASIFAIAPLNGPFIYPAILADIAGLLLLAAGLPRGVPRASRQVALAVLLFAPVFFLVQACLSNWELWYWYFYPLAFALAIGGALVVAALPRPGPVPWLRTSVLLAWLALAFGAVWGIEMVPAQASNGLYGAALAIRDFARTHPGTYAMGDRAGTVGFMLGQPLVQTEGLVMDAAFLANIQARRDLAEVLRAYGVDYHIATDPERRGGCWHVEEPRKAPPPAPRMATDFCEPPLFTFRAPGATTMIFRVPPAP